jgi:hypothetical protein
VSTYFRVFPQEGSASLPRYAVGEIRNLAKLGAFPLLNPTLMCDVCVLSRYMQWTTSTRQVDRRTIAEARTIRWRINNDVIPVTFPEVYDLYENIV